jgi:hypothetical protein
MSSPPFNHSMHQSAYNPSYRNRHSPQRSEEYSSDEDYDSEYDGRNETPERSHPVHPTFSAEVPRDIPRRGQFTPHDRYAPPGVYDPSSQRAPIEPSLTHSSYQHDGNLIAYASHQSSDAGQFNDRPRRDRAGSVASHSSRQSHRSHRSSTSHHSDRSKYDKNGRRKSKHTEDRRPTMSDSVILLWNSFKGAFDGRK